MSKLSREAFLKIIQDNEQDRAELRSWWGDTSYDAKMRVLERIQAQHDDPVDEIVSRLAQLAFAEAFEQYEDVAEPEAEHG
jgi:hypothetical protein